MQIEYPAWRPSSSLTSPHNSHHASHLASQQGSKILLSQLPFDENQKAWRSYVFRGHVYYGKFVDGRRPIKIEIMTPSSSSSRICTSYSSSYSSSFTPLNVTPNPNSTLTTSQSTCWRYKKDPSV
ncbi:hypothetical protein D9758_003116 [Tetrapyrgos nigripes]|uniref:Uncharacterized protein n=1 Tax=Tetrapyrgos nigripes TaxID=182062 RepID=A0A8H5GQ84_9AGAR|nr:hypothetical protein D9758_003116 [Tetrapyrgos nigripes]